MFTGLVQAVGMVVRHEPRPSGVRLGVQPGGWGLRPSLGDSIAISGVCLTLVEVAADGSWAFDIVRETLDKTTLGSLGSGSRVNLEGSLRADGHLGGHFVQGHVDGVCRVVKVSAGDDWRVTLTIPAGLEACVVPKGSVTLDGVSLTIAAVDHRAGTLEVALIPETLTRTTLAAWKAGQGVNFEADMLAKTVLNVLRNIGGLGLIAGAAGEGA